MSYLLTFDRSEISIKWESSQLEEGNFEQGKVRMRRILGLIEFAVMSRFRRRNHKLANLEEWASREDGCPFGVASDRLG